MALPTTELCVAAEEQTIGRRLPRAHRDRLVRENGGEIFCDGEAWQLHPVWDPSDRRTSQRSANHIARETEAARRWRGFPDGGVAVGEDGSGNRLVLLPGSDDIYRWDHETLVSEPASVTW
jgi:hypothetical protein